MTKSTRKKPCQETVEEAVINNKKEIAADKKKVVSGWKRFWFPKQGISVIAKTLKEAEKKVKAITGYKNKSI